MPKMAEYSIWPEIGDVIQNNLKGEEEGRKRGGRRGGRRGYEPLLVEAFTINRVDAIVFCCSALVKQSLKEGTQEP